MSRSGVLLQVPQGNYSSQNKGLQVWGTSAVKDRVCRMSLMIEGFITGITALSLERSMEVIMFTVLLAINNHKK
jgi:hypothetical protein